MPGDTAPRALPRGRKRAKRAPGARTLLPSVGSVTLEEVLVGFQRSLSRATRSSLETARADWQVGMGQRALYVVDGIGVSLQAGVVMARDAEGHVQAVSLDLGGSGGPGQATLDFRVAARPIEAIVGEQVVLADLDPLGLQRPRHLMRVTLIGALEPGEPAVKPLREVPVREVPRSPRLEANTYEQKVVETAPAPAPVWSPLPDREVHVYVVGSATGRTEAFKLNTNSVGQLDVEIDAMTNRITSGERSTTFSELDLTGRDDEFFVWAACKPGPLTKGITVNLTSNVLQYSVKREARKG